MEGSQPTAFGRLVGAEMLGMVLVMLGGPGLAVLSGDASPLAYAIGIGIAMAVSIAVIGAVANPMFSLALWFARSIQTRELFADWTGQFLGGALGGFMIFGINNTHRFSVGVNGWSKSDGAATGVDLGMSTGPFAELGVVIAAELLLGTIVVAVMLSAIRNMSSTAAAAGFIGATYTMATMVLYRISGGGINPARSLGAALFANTDPNALAQVWVFIVIPIACSFFGMLLWLGNDDATVDDTVFDDTIVESATDAVTGDK